MPVPGGYDIAEIVARATEYDKISHVWTPILDQITAAER